MGKLSHNEPFERILITATIFLVAITLGFAMATQWVAYQLHYPAVFGNPFFLLQDIPIYNPFSYVAWLLRYNDVAPVVFSQAMLPIFACVGLGVAVTCIYKLFSGRSTSNPTTFGSARFATLSEIEKSGLRDDKGGVVLGFDAKNRYLCHNGAEHIKVIAPTRSGKGVGLVIPTLLNWQHSVVVNDVKGELWRATAGWRKRISVPIAFDPTSKVTARYNPLFEVRLGDYEIKDVQNITSMIVDPEGKGKTDHWTKEADAYLVAVILHVLYAEPNKTLAGVYQFINNPKKTLDQTLQTMLHTKHLGEQGVHSVVAMGARAMMNKSGNERTGVHSSAKAFLSLYVDPIVAAATSESDFSVMDLQHHEKPVSLYLIFPPSDIERLKPLFRLILTQITSRLTETHNPKSSKHRLLLLLDEFPSLGKLSFFETALGYTAGYGIKAMLISQNYNQLIDTYGKNNSIVDSCHVRVYFAPNTEESAEIISRALGATTAVRKQTNRSGSRFNLMLNHVMVTEQESARRLMTSGEVMVLPPSDEIILLAGHYPIHAKKIYYYKDQELNRRASFSVPVIPDERPYPFATQDGLNAWLELPIPAPIETPKSPESVTETSQEEATSTAPHVHSLPESPAIASHLADETIIDDSPHDDGLEGMEEASEAQEMTKNLLVDEEWAEHTITTF